MKMILSVVAVALASTLGVDPAHGWASANRYGGSTTHSYGSTSHTNAYGGSSSHEAGEGTEHTNTYGGSTSTAPTAAPSTPTCTAAPRPGHTGQGRITPIRRVRPTTIRRPIRSITRRWPCRITRPAAMGVQPQPVLWLESLSARRQLPPTRPRRHRTRMPQVWQQAARTRRAAYNAGVATGVAAASAPASGTYVMSVNYAALPAGAMVINKNGATYYLSGNTWFKPSYGANGVYYTVVPAP